MKAPGHLELEFFSQVNFIGLFVHKDYYDFLEDIVATYAEEIRKVGKSLSTFLFLYTLFTLFHVFFPPHPNCASIWIQVCFYTCISYLEYTSRQNLCKINFIVQVYPTKEIYDFRWSWHILMFLVVANKTSADNSKWIQNNFPRENYQFDCITSRIFASIFDGCEKMSVNLLYWFVPVDFVVVLVGGCK